MMAMKNSSNTFYRHSYQTLILFIMALMICLLFLVCILLYQVSHRPLPQFFARGDNGKELSLDSHDQPNLLPATLIKWARKAAVTAYTFDFVNYNKEIAALRNNFTDAGWADYQNSIQRLLDTITQNQLFVSSVVSGPPVISNQGDLPGHGYVWRIQMPFLVTYQSANATSQRSFTVIMTIAKVPTWRNPAGIGIDQFLMS